jgi:hypothetical protein
MKEKQHLEECSLHLKKLLHDYKEHEFYESERRKKRKKKRDAELQRLKVKLRENFPNRKTEKKDNRTNKKKK